MAKNKTAAQPIDLDQLNKFLRSCAETAAYLKTCEDCDLDVDKEQRLNAEQAATATKLKARFFPNAK